MEIYRLVYVSDTYKAIDYDHSETFENKSFETNGTDLQNLRWVESDSNNPVSDFPFIMGSIPIISEKTTTVLQSFIDKSDIKLVPITVENERFYYLHFKTLLRNILNEKASKLLKFKNGDIMDIEKYVFKQIKEDIPPIFKITELDKCVFVSGEVAQSITANNLVGIKLEKCEQKKLGLFDKLF